MKHEMCPERAGRNTTPDKPTGNGGEDEGESAPPKTTMKPCERRAYLAWKYAESATGRQLTDREAHEYLQEYGIDTRHGDAGELADYDLPGLQSFSQYLTNARRAVGESKYSPRGGRRGRSTAPKNDL
jgi:hypothetical protein